MNIIRNLKLRILIKKNIKNLKEIRECTIKSIEELKRQRTETDYNEIYVMYEFEQATKKEIDFYRRSIKMKMYKNIFNINELKTKLRDFERMRSKILQEYCFITILNIFEDISYTPTEWIDAYKMLIILKEHNKKQKNDVL